ncbi:DUF7830 domain-containing protein [Neisseria mucosa]|jgi:hypothetical protein|uniref:DUF7830 domain-containing protein n=1 Tax=Neisseria mucosa TaxID=488 RepID=UPI000D363E3F|nr:hypothetical protein [Neisseria mucosa]
MLTALHPHKDVTMTPDEYIKEFGMRIIGSVHDLRPRPRCRFCKQDMQIRAASTSHTHAHFAHMQKSGPCPSKVLNARPYLNKFPTKPNLEQASYLKKQFKQNWKQHYEFIRKNLIENLAPSELGNLLKEANRLRIWEYEGLQEHELPYVLCTLADFPQQDKKVFKQYTRTLWTRCWFDSSLEDFNLLWIENSRPTGFWVACYTPPTGKQKIPRLDNLVKAERISIGSDYLQLQPHMSDKLIDYVEKILNENLK